MKVKGDVDMRRITFHDVFNRGGYSIEHYVSGGDYWPQMAEDCYATREEAIKGLKEIDEVLLRWGVEIKEYPGNCKPGKVIDIADLEAPENE